MDFDGNEITTESPAQVMTNLLLTFKKLSWIHAIKNIFNTKEEKS